MVARKVWISVTMADETSEVTAKSSLALASLDALSAALERMNDSPTVTTTGLDDVGAISPVVKNSVVGKTSLVGTGVNGVSVEIVAVVNSSGASVEATDSLDANDDSTSAVETAEISSDVATDSDAKTSVV